MSSAKLGDRQRAELGHQKILHDLGIALVGLWTDFFPDSGKPSGKPFPNGHARRIDVFASVEGAEQAPQLAFSIPAGSANCRRRDPAFPSS